MDVVVIRYSVFIILFINTYFAFCFSDFRYEEKIAPGVIYFHEYYSSGPWHIHVLEIDLHSSDIILESAIAKNSLLGREKTSSISANNNCENHYVTAAINADFFELNGNPVGGQIINEELINKPASRSVFGITINQKPFINVVSWKGEFASRNGRLYEIKGLNEKRKADTWTFYNLYFGEDTLSDVKGIVINARLLSDLFHVNEKMQFQIGKMERIRSVILKPDIIKNKEILLVGPYTDNLDFNIGDTLKVLLELYPVGERIKLLVGGLPRIIRDGKVSIEWKTENIRESFSSQRHPRTAVGFTEDKQKVLLFVVDGRQPGYSVGMTLLELATYMRKWAIYQGVNLDGGGSSTMVVHGVVENRPSDQSGERPVANALLVINSKDHTIAKRLNIIPDKISLQAGSSFQFQTDFLDMNYLPVDMKVDSVNWTCPQNLGVINRLGMFQADSSLGSGYLYVQKGPMIDSTMITIVDTLVTWSK